MVSLYHKKLCLENREQICSSDQRNIFISVFREMWLSMWHHPQRVGNQENAHGHVHRPLKERQSLSVVSSSQLTVLCVK